MGKKFSIPGGPNKNIKIINSTKPKMQHERSKETIKRWSVKQQKIVIVKKEPANTARSYIKEKPGNF